jgi:hypothetical protein
MKDQMQTKASQTRLLTESREVLLIVLNALLLRRAVLTAVVEVVLLAIDFFKNVFGALDQSIRVLGLLGVDDGGLLDLLANHLEVGVIDNRGVDVLDFLFVAQVDIEAGLGEIFVSSNDFFDFRFLDFNWGLVLVLAVNFTFSVVKFLLVLSLSANVALSMSSLLEIMSEGGFASATVTLEGSLLARGVVSFIAGRVVRAFVGGVLLNLVTDGLSELGILLAAFLLVEGLGLGLGGLRFLIVAVVLGKHAKDVLRHYKLQLDARVVF